jgi:hypothetical protein
MRLAVLCVVRTRRLIGVLTLVVLLAVAAGVSGLQLPNPGVGGSSERGSLPGVRAIGASSLLRVGAGAPVGGQLAFLAIDAAGTLIVSDAKRQTVMRYDSTGHLISEWGPRLGDASLVEPAGVATSNDSI